MDAKKSKETNESESQQQQSQELVALPSQHVVKEHAKIEHLRREGMPLDEAVMHCIEQCSELFLQVHYFC